MSNILVPQKEACPSPLSLLPTEGIRMYSQQYSPSLAGSVPLSQTRRNIRTHPGEAMSPSRRLFLSSGRHKETLHISWHNLRICCTIFSSRAHEFNSDSSNLLPKNKLPVPVRIMGKTGPDPALPSPRSSSTTPPRFQEGLHTHGQGKHFILCVLPH